jgi:hypothetical protein
MGQDQRRQLDAISSQRHLLAGQISRRMPSREIAEEAARDLAAGAEETTVEDNAD